MERGEGKVEGKVGASQVSRQAKHLGIRRPVARRSHSILPFFFFFSISLFFYFSFVFSILTSTIPAFSFPTMAASSRAPAAKT